MNFALNQIFDNSYPPEAAQFCNQNGYVIKEIDKTDDKRRFQIQEIPAPTPEQQAAARRQEIHAELDRIDRASSRSLRAIITAQAAGREPDTADTTKLATYEAAAMTLREELKALGNA